MGVSWFRQDSSLI